MFSVAHLVSTFSRKIQILIKCWEIFQLVLCLLLEPRLFIAQNSYKWENIATTDVLISSISKIQCFFFSQAHSFQTGTFEKQSKKYFLFSK